MFRRRVRLDYVGADGKGHPCPVKWIDNFAMRNFTNGAIFDKTLPVGDLLLKIGNWVPVDRLAVAIEDWFRRKGYVVAGEFVRLTEL